MPKSWWVEEVPGSGQRTSSTDMQSFADPQPQSLVRVMISWRGVRHFGGDDFASFLDFRAMRGEEIPQSAANYMLCFYFADR